MRIGELGEAERDFLAALQQREVQHPDEPDHPSFASSINNLAALHLKQHRLQEAHDGFSRVIRIHTSTQKTNPSSRVSMEIDIAKKNLACVERFLARERPPEAVPAAMAGGSRAQGSDAGGSATDSLWVKLRAAKGSDLLKSTALRQKEQVAKKMGINIKGRSEAEIDDLIRRSLRGEDVDGKNTELIKIQVNLAFDLLDEDGGGTISRMELLKGMRDHRQVRQADCRGRARRPHLRLAPRERLRTLPADERRPRRAQVREMLKMEQFTDPAHFNEIYHAIDADGSGEIDHKEFETYFMRKLAPGEQQYETKEERATRVMGSVAERFRSTAQPPASPKKGDARNGDAPPADPTGNHHYRLSSSSGMSQPEFNDLTAYDETTRGLEHAHRRKAGIEKDIAALQHELRSIEADIVSRSATADKLRSALSSHRSSHSSVIGQMDERIRQLDHANQLARRPALATSERLERSGRLE